MGADVYPLPPETVVNPVTSPDNFMFAVNEPTTGRGSFGIISTGKLGVVCS